MCSNCIHYRGSFDLLGMLKGEEVSSKRGWCLYPEEETGQYKGTSDTWNDRLRGVKAEYTCGEFVQRKPDVY